MGRQRAHRRQKQRLEDSAEFIRTHCTVIGEWRRVRAQPPNQRVSLWGHYGRYVWTCICGEQLKAVATEIAGGPGLLLACGTCGQVYQQRDEPPLAVRPVRLPDDREVCDQLRIAMVGSSPTVKTRGLALSFDFASGKVRAYQPRGDEWDRVLEVDAQAEEPKAGEDTA